MKLPLLLHFLGLLLFISSLSGQTRTTSADLQKEGQAVRLTPQEGVLNVGIPIRITFPQPMVSNDLLNQDGQPSPLAVEPPLPGTFRWLSPTEGRYYVQAPLIPGQAYQASLISDLKDINANPVPRPEWVGKFTSAPLQALSDFQNQGNSLVSLPQVPIRFTYPVTLNNAQASIYFQDRDTRERFAAEFTLDGVYTENPDEPVAAPSEVEYLLASPVIPLGVNRTIDLVIDGITDAGTKKANPLIKVIPLGDTRPLTINEVYASAPPFEEPSIILRMSSPVDQETLTPESVIVQPEVPGLQYISNASTIELKGKFDLNTTYRVQLGDSIRGAVGFAPETVLEQEVAFKGFTAAITFPRSTFFQRSHTGLNTVFLQSNSGEVTWNLSPIPMEKMHLIQEQLKEYLDDEQDPFTGLTEAKRTDLLTQRFQLEPMAQGTFSALSNVEAEYRNIRWQPENGGSIPSGPYLLEASAETSSGKVIGNRSLIYFNEVVVIRKFSNTEATIKVMAMGDGAPVANAKVEVTDHVNTLIVSKITDNEGVARFRAEEVRDADRYPTYVKVESSAGTAIQPFYGERFYNSAWISRYSQTETTASESTVLASLITDRNLYRPGHEVHLKGIYRIGSSPEAAKKLSIPSGSTVRWWISEGYEGKRMIEGTATLDEFGSFDAQWNIPDKVSLGTYYINCALSDSIANVQSETFQIEEYRVPLFSVDLKTEPREANELAKISVQSHYFHGSPNSAAVMRWTAHCSPYDTYENDFSETDNHSPTHTESLSSHSIDGETRLDESGSAVISIANPYPSPLSHSRFHVYFTADVISPEGQTISSAVSTEIMAFEHAPRIRLTTVEAVNEDKDADEAVASQVKVDFEATDQEGNVVKGLPANIKLYYVENHSVKERLGAGVYRYRNFPQFILVEERVTITGETSVFPAERTGSYIAVGKLTELPETPVVSDQVNSTGEGDGYYEVYNDAQFAIQADKAVYAPGETAQLTLEAPFGGKAWVSLETNGILDHFVVDLPSNGTPIHLPIKEYYHPNVFATVYLLQPGGTEHLPMERFGKVELKVDRPDLSLEVTPKLTESEVEPGGSVQGVVLITAGGQTLPNADVTLFAVDDAVLELGLWQKPDLVNHFYRERQHEVATYRALIDHYEAFDESQAVEKGFLIGGGGIGMQRSELKSVRSDFKPLAYWRTNLRSDEKGEVRFNFKAPDNLTRFRVIAIAQSLQNQFGSGETTFTVAKKLMVEPALPRFARTHDDLEFRAVVRQDYVDQMAVQIRCIISEGVEWLGESQEISLTLQKGVPNVVRFPANITSSSPLSVRFEAHSLDQAEITDGVEVTLPLHAPGILQRTGYFGEIVLGQDEVNLGAHLPDLWKEAEGNFNLTVSYTPYLPELKGLPEVLEYPHGCLEQKSTRYLTYTVLTDLLEYLPELKERHANYRARLEQGLLEYERAILSDGFLPYWAGGEKPNPWVTVMAYWVVVKAQQDGFTVPPQLAENMPKAIDAIIRGTLKLEDNHLTRAFALFVRSEGGFASADYQDVFTDLHARRDSLPHEALAFLSMAAKNHGIMEAERLQWLSKMESISGSITDSSFDPDTFSSLWRGRTISLLAQARMTDDDATLANLQKVFLDSKLESGPASVIFSTQENYWRLLTIKTLMDGGNSVRFNSEDTVPKADFVSANGASIAWKTQVLKQTANLILNHKADQASPAWYLIDAEVLRTSEDDQQRESRGFRLERVIKNMTDSSRIGTKEAPFVIGDEVLITYRFETTRLHYYVALTDELPAGLETVNFNLPQVAQFYQLPEDANASLWLSHSELRDQSANLYFDYVRSGMHHYSILARVTAVGEFYWPPTQISPMYHPHFNGLSAPQEIVSKDDN